MSFYAIIARPLFGYCLLRGQAQWGIQLTYLSYTIIESMQPSLSEDSNTIGEDSSYFLCTCGAEFELLHHYEKHLRVKHQLRTIISPDNHTQNQEPLSRIIKKAQQLSENLNVEVKPIEDSQQHSSKIPNRQMRSKEERRRAIQTLSKGRYYKKNSDLDQETVNWQGFKLVKNKYCHNQPYYCGTCKTIFFQMEDYITHCIQDCQTLIHKDSSHMISLDLKEESTSDVLSDIEDLYSNLQQSRNPQQIANQQEVDNKPFKQILRYGLDHKKIPFYCGQCRRNFRSYNYYIHITNDHGQVIDQNSSHIIVKCFYNSNIMLLYLSSHVRWITQEKKYFCACNPKQKLRMEDLIQHIKTEHAGISPLYVFQTHSQMKESQSQNSQNANLRSMKKQALPYKYVKPQPHIKQLLSFHNIYDIAYKLQDHRNIPFSCGSCSATFKNPLSYKRHLYNHHNQKLSKLSSHVILQLQNGHEKHSLYMCPSIKWHHDQLIYFCPCSINNKVSMSSLLLHVITEHNHISPVYFQQTRINRDQIMENQACIIRDPMNYLRRKGIDSQNVPFSCYPCNLVLKTVRQYRTHMRDVHNNTIHPCSSHIIFQFKKYRYRQRTMLLVSPHIKWAIAEHSNYYCSCEPERKITMEALIQHIIQNHHGISPEYVFQECIIKRQNSIKNQRTKTKEFDGTKYEQ